MAEPTTAAHSSRGRPLTLKVTRSEYYILEDTTSPRLGNHHTVKAEHTVTAAGALGSPACSSDGGSHRSYVAWSKQESDLLRDLVLKHGAQRKWSTISSQIPGRSSKQCRDRWVNHMKSGPKQDSWALEEDFLLAYYHSKVGTKWAKIASVLPGRTSTSVKNHWNSTCRSKTLASKRSLLCAYTTGLQVGLSPAVAFQNSVDSAKQSYLFTKLKDQLDSVPTDTSANDPGSASDDKQHSSTSKSPTSSHTSTTHPASPSDDEATSSEDTSHAAFPPFSAPTPASAPLPFLPPPAFRHANPALQFMSQLTDSAMLPSHESLMDVTSQSLSFDLDALLASNPGLDPSLLPELMEEGCLVQDLDGLALAPAMSSSAPYSLPAAAAATAAAVAETRAAAAPTGFAHLINRLQASPAAASAAAAARAGSIQQLAGGNARLLPPAATLLGAGPQQMGHPGSLAAAMQSAALGMNPDVLIQEVISRSFKLGQLMALCSVAPGGPAPGGATNGNVAASPVVGQFGAGFSSWGGMI